MRNLDQTVRTADLLIMTAFIYALRFVSKCLAVLLVFPEPVNLSEQSLKKAR